MDEAKTIVLYMSKHTIVHAAMKEYTKDREHLRIEEDLTIVRPKAERRSLKLCRETFGAKEERHDGYLGGKLKRSQSSRV
ncbi:hypothetical protein AKJ16_DCAP08874 [Drosera capensis]